jgi:MerR family mercuric resistance operon transcriptional regulator
MPESLTIGALAKAANVHVETVRYYQRRGLLREPARPLNGIRRYGVADVSRLRFIKHAQQSGFSLDEVRALLRLSGRPACGASRALAARKLTAIEEKMRILARLRRELRAWVAACDANTGDSCPALEKLAH